MVNDDPFSLVRRFGVKVLEVADLRDPVVLVREHGVALIRAGLPAEVRQAAADLLLSAALDPSPASRLRPR